VAYSSPSNYRPPAHIYGQAPDYADDWVAFANYYMKNIWKGTGKPRMALSSRTTRPAPALKPPPERCRSARHRDCRHRGTCGGHHLRNGSPDPHQGSQAGRHLYLQYSQRRGVIIKNAKDSGCILSDHRRLPCRYDQSARRPGRADVVNGIYGVASSAEWGANVPGMAKMMEYAQKNHPKDAGNADYAAAWAQASSSPRFSSRR